MNSPARPDTAAATEILPVDDTGPAAGRTVVLLHARPTDRSMWSAHLQEFAAAGVRAIAVDLPGYGDAAGRTVDPWSAVPETLAARGDRRCVLVGNSLGALVALQVAAVNPELVEGLVALGYRPHDQPPSAMLQAAWDQEKAALARGDVDGAVRAGVTAWTAPSTPEATKTLVARMLRNNVERRNRNGEPTTGADPLQRPGGLRSVHVPALVAVGALDMPDFFDGGEALARELGAGPLVVVPGAAHLVPLDQPAAFRRLVLDFLDSLEGRE
ncbi:alpha/beta fold hydrolase [Mycolicibacterium parafortuitum]|uniref:Putative peptidase S33 family protein [Kitasatospora setae KM-6054] n=1 Tax=Mycolicibacterium parafortuitum TaxID=39692 RepID=A0A375YPH3_MYCPF|nr:alpha/beta hydrolase [Mycolicibacterium parafortuitum]ORB29738.1 3-oxoadipate enol-lactonase [Mycolicibacterium parafortuitum]SRX83067.1 putative peptidase S33 family protein [Kitasatospora setae KM-6054] [Mycolicibacterium parafortuitum]